MNYIIFRVNEPGKDPGFGQSILHEGHLIFRTPPYVLNSITLQDAFLLSKIQGKDRQRIFDTKTPTLERERKERATIHSSPSSFEERRNSRRFSSTSIRSSILKDVPYARLIETCPAALPTKLDSDSKLHTEKGKLFVNVPHGDVLPKNSISDSKLAVDYFNAPEIQRNKEAVSISIFKNKFGFRLAFFQDVNDDSTAASKTAVTVSESHHSLNDRISLNEELQKQVSSVFPFSRYFYSLFFFPRFSEQHQCRAKTTRRLSSPRTKI